MKDMFERVIDWISRTPRCRRCSRPLRSAESRAIGYGPTCARQFKAKLEHARLESQGQLCFPGLDR